MEREEPDALELPTWMEKAIANATRLPTPEKRSVLEYRNSEAWPLFVDAALVPKFLPRELAPSVEAGDARGAAERTVLEFAQTRLDTEGSCWALEPGARAAVIGAALRSDDLAKAIDRTAPHFSDPVSTALRDCVQGTVDTDADVSADADLDRLEALRTAVSLLGDVEGLALPSLDQLDRNIELRRLLVQFERMTGKTTQRAGDSREDRFFGRQAEIEQLREFVDVVAADTFYGRAKRAAQRVVRAVIRGRPPLNVWGIGGVGKTTLMAKFMLEHAHAAETRFPFAYLDFDRSTVNARNLPALLIEITLQVGSQFPELAQPMLDLREHLRETVRKASASGADSRITLPSTYLAQFRQLVDSFLDDQERRFERARPFLLVFDTFELVLYTPSDVLRLEEFVRGFSGGRKLWPRLRLVISGRKQVTGFVEETQPLNVDALDREGSIDMLVVLARDAGKEIATDDAARLIEAVTVALGGNRKGGLHPLRLRLLGELFKQHSTETGPEIVDGIVEELNSPSPGETSAGRTLVDGLLVRRILDHVEDPRVQALADPGLVVRRITPDVIREVMAKGTRKPAKGEDTARRSSADDSLEFEPWVIEPKEANDIFKAFRREVTLVDEDGAALRHRQDVRQEMLPLIRASRPKRFEHLNKLAFDYFRGQSEQNKNDEASAGEAIYHGLRLNKPLTEIDHLWSAHASFDPRIDREEFDAGGTPDVYLRARANDRLSEGDVKQLPQALALDWLRRRTPTLLNDPEVNGSVAAARAAAGVDFRALQSTDVGPIATIVRLLYRAGLWADGAQLALERLDLQALGSFVSRGLRSGDVGFMENLSLSENPMVSIMRTLVTFVAKSGGAAEDLGVLSEWSAEITNIVDRVECLAHIVLASRVAGHDPRRAVAALRDLIPRVEHGRWFSNVRVLRLAILTKPRELPELLALYFGVVDQLPRDAAATPQFQQLFSDVYPTAPSEKPPREKGLVDGPTTNFDSIETKWRAEKPAFLEAIRTRPELAEHAAVVAAFDHSDWINPLAHSLSGAIRSPLDLVVRSALKSAVPKDTTPPFKSDDVDIDGLRVVHFFSEATGLLPLAEALRSAARAAGIVSRRGQRLPPFLTSSRRVPDGYPKDVVGIAEALIGWHGALVANLDTSARSE